MIQPPSMEGAALGFVHSREWEVAKADLMVSIAEVVARNKETEGADLVSLRAAVREVASKTIRSKMQCKPTIQVVIHEVETAGLG
jgi:hypothetical protein